MEFDAKIVMLGNSYAGKTTLINCMKNGPSEKNFPVTSGR